MKKLLSITVIAILNIGIFNAQSINKTIESLTSNLELRYVLKDGREFTVDKSRKHRGANKDNQTIMFTDNRGNDIKFKRKDVAEMYIGSGDYSYYKRIDYNGSQILVLELIKDKLYKDSVEKQPYQGYVRTVYMYYLKENDVYVKYKENKIRKKYKCGKTQNIEVCLNKL